MYPTVPSTPNINGARDTSAQKPASAASPSTRSDHALTTTLRNSSTRPRGLSGRGRDAAARKGLLVAATTPSRYGHRWTSPGHRLRNALRRYPPPSRRSRISCRTTAALACPFVAFITAPTSAPAAATLPARTLAATGALVGAVMKATNGQANAAVVRQLILERLDGGG